MSCNWFQITHTVSDFHSVWTAKCWWLLTHVTSMTGANLQRICASQLARWTRWRPCELRRSSSDRRVVGERAAAPRIATLVSPTSRSARVLDLAASAPASTTSTPSWNAPPSATRSSTFTSNVRISSSNLRISRCERSDPRRDARHSSKHCSTFRYNHPNVETNYIVLFPNFDPIFTSPLPMWYFML